MIFILLLATPQYAGRTYFIPCLLMAHVSTLPIHYENYQSRHLTHTIYSFFIIVMTAIFQLCYEVNFVFGNVYNNILCHIICMELEPDVVHEWRVIMCIIFNGVSAHHPTVQHSIITLTFIISRFEICGKYDAWAVQGYRDLVKSYIWAYFITRLESCLGPITYPVITEYNVPYLKTHC